MEATDKRIQEKYSIDYHLNVNEIKNMHSLLKKVIRISDPVISAQPNFTEEELRVAELFVFVAEKRNLI